MKLALLTFNAVRALPLPEVLKLARAHGFAAVELRCQLGHGHGVELGLGAAERAAVRDAFDDANLDIAGLTISNRFEYPEPAQRRASIDEAKRYLDLAGDLDAHRVRVFGNDMPAGVPRAQVIGQVAEALRELGEHADELGLEINLEMHGQFNWWRYALRAVQAAEHAAVGIVYNCDRRDLVGGSIRPTLSSVLEWVNHVHLHELSDPRYPYQELFAELDAWGYQGYLSAEIEETGEPDRLLGYYAALYRALLPR